MVFSIDDIRAPYISALDAEMRQVVEELAPKEAEFDVLLRFPMGWVDEHGTDYPYPTGKRLRPLILLLICEGIGGDWRKALPAAAAVEFLHNFSLIHDDIEDKSPLRHNRPTVWKIWGTAKAINIGDSLFSVAYKALLRLAQTGISCETHLRAIEIFTQTVYHISYGQHLDISFETQEFISVDDYIEMIGGKTAALIGACAELGALIGSENVDIAQKLALFGFNIGIAFQIHDDILGIWGDQEITGKSASSDIETRKKSLPVLYGLMHSESLQAIYKKPELSADDVQAALNALDACGAQEYAREYEQRYIEKAYTAIEDITLDDIAAKKLNNLIDFLLQRQY